MAFHMFPNVFQLETMLSSMATKETNSVHRGVEYVGTGEPGSQALFFCQALFAYKLKRVW